MTTQSRFSAVPIVESGNLGITQEIFLPGGEFTLACLDSNVVKAGRMLYRFTPSFERSEVCSFLDDMGQGFLRESCPQSRVHCVARAALDGGQLEEHGPGSRLAANNTIRRC